YDVVVPRLPRGAGSNLSSESGITARVSLDRVEHLPQVADAVRFHIYGATGRDLEVNGSEDPRFNRVMEQPKLLAGRLPRPDAVHEAAVNLQEAAFLGLHVGGSITLRFDRPDQRGTPTPFTFRVVGIEARAGEL